VEIDCTPATVNRQIPDAYTGPRVTKVVYAVDTGLPINPLGLQAQMMGGIMDGIAQALTYSLHLQDGYFLEGSWDNAYYTRQWNVTFEVDVIVMPTSFPISHDLPLGFTPYPSAVGPARSPGDPRPEIRLRPAGLPGVHLSHQRQGVQPMLGARVRHQVRR